MALVIKLELSPEIRARLQDGLARHDKEQVYQLLKEALIPTVETWLQYPPAVLHDDEFDTLVDQLNAKLAAGLSSDAPVLSDEAISRAAIYEEHP